jgi:hypothetical protein
MIRVVEGGVGESEHEHDERDLSAAGVAIFALLFFLSKISNCESHLTAIPTMRIRSQIDVQILSEPHAKQHPLNWGWSNYCGTVMYENQQQFAKLFRGVSLVSLGVR